MQLQINGSETQKNLRTSVIGESEASLRYRIYSEIAKDDGYIMISQQMERISAQEKEHAQKMISYFDGSIETFQGDRDISPLRNTESNITYAIAAEHKEFTSIYAGFAETAKNEGLTEISKLYEDISLCELHHHGILITLKEQMSFHSKHAAHWYCLNCGYIHKGESAPGKCPVCDHKKEWFTMTPTL